MSEKMPTHEELEEIINALPVDRNSLLTSGYLNFPAGTPVKRLHAWNDGLDTKYRVYAPLNQD